MATDEEILKAKLKDLGSDYSKEKLKDIAKNWGVDKYLRWLNGEEEAPDNIPDSDVITENVNKDWWGKNRGWVVPVGIGLGALGILVGIMKK